VSLDWESEALAEGLRCYRNAEFWNAHEHWENVWLRLEEPEKSFLQALIQTTAAFHHVQTGNIRGGVSLLDKALRRFGSCPEAFGNIDLAQLREEAGVWLLALKSNKGPRPAAVPQIRTGSARLPAPECGRPDRNRGLL
jgi:predicted metal-dependent hydrolase